METICVIAILLMTLGIALAWMLRREWMRVTRERKERDEIEARQALDAWEDQMEAWQQTLSVERGGAYSLTNLPNPQQILTDLENLLRDVLKSSHLQGQDTCEDHAGYPEPPPVKLPVTPFKLINQLSPALLDEYRKKLQLYESRYQEASRAWEMRCRAYLGTRDKRNAAIRRIKSKYQAGDRVSIVEYCTAVLARSPYPEFISPSYELDYFLENKLLVVDYQLPPLKSIPTLREVRYVQSRHAHVEKHLTQRELYQLYDSVLYQIVLRSIHELYTADDLAAIASIAFNGYVRSIDPATGHEINPCVLSIQASKEEFQAINLANVDLKACFKSLKGVGSSKLHSLTPIAPVVKIEREDKRFIAPRAVAETLEEGDNLAAMDWEDFEHLVRELFEREFARPGGEVKVTRASRDGGIDAVAFDPDSLHGGKTVIQAKRYTNTVGVSAVRDLYGTLMNEGANRGILVTTSDYGPDAYDFAKGKPLVLLNGGNLLHLLQRHGYRAKIDLQEARRTLAEREKE